MFGSNEDAARSNAYIKWHETMINNEIDDRKAALPELKINELVSSFGPYYF